MPSRAPLEQRPPHLPTKGTSKMVLQTSLQFPHRILCSKTQMLAHLPLRYLGHLPLICTTNWLLPCLAPGNCENEHLAPFRAPRLSLKKGSLFGLSHLKIISRFSLLFSPPHAASQSCPVSTRPPRTMFANDEKQGVLLFQTNLNPH